MAGIGSSGNKKQSGTAYKNTFEAIKGIGGSVVKNTGDEFKKIGSGFFDQLVGNYDTDFYNTPEKYSPKPEIKKPQFRRDVGIFSYNEYYERSIVKKQIKELSEQIKKEIEFIKKANKSLMSEVREVERVSMEELPEKPGIYHLRFLEVILSFLRLIKTKINESGSWLNAMVSRRKKRGSLFAHLAKKKGTQYSLSQELQLTRQTG